MGGKDSEPVYAEPQGDITQRTAPPEWLEPYMTQGADALQTFANTPRNYVDQFVAPSGLRGTQAAYLTGGAGAIPQDIASAKGIVGDIAGQGPVGYQSALGVGSIPGFSHSAPFSQTLDMQGPLSRVMDDSASRAINRTMDSAAMHGRTGSPAVAEAAARGAGSAQAAALLPALQAEHAAAFGTHQANEASRRNAYGLNAQTQMGLEGLSRQGFQAGQGASLAHNAQRLGAAGMIPGLSMQQWMTPASLFDQAAGVDESVRGAHVSADASRQNFENEEGRRRWAEYMAQLTGFAPVAGGSTTTPNMPIGYQQESSMVGPLLGLGLSLAGMPMAGTAAGVAGGSFGGNMLGRMFG